MGKPKIIDIEQLIDRTVNSLNAGARQYMKKTGSNEVKNIMVDVINEEIYDRYTPMEYKRRGSRGGLKDKKNMKDSVTTTKAVNGLAEGHLYIVNKTPRDTSIKLKSKQATSAISFANTIEDFLFSLKDDPNRSAGIHYKEREGVFNLWNSPSWGVWGNMGRPLYITVEVDKRVQNSKEIRAKLRAACLNKARSDMGKRRS